MNTALWMIYLAGVVGALTGTLAVLGGIFFMGSAIWRIAHYADPTNAKPAPRYVFGASIAAIAIAIALPTTNTLYAIAATNVGDAYLKTETGSKALKALNAWLDRQIADEPEKNSQ